MKILAFAGSNSSQSINRQLVTFVAEQFVGNEIEIVDLNDFEMPIFSEDREKNEGIPEKAQVFAEKIDSADLLLISLAEHNSSYTTAFKNIFDWISRIKNRKHFGDKPVFLMAAATGPGGGKHVLAAFQARAPFSGATVTEVFSLPKFKENFAEGKGVLDPEKSTELHEKIQKVKALFGI